MSKPKKAAQKLCPLCNTPLRRTAKSFAKMGIPYLCPNPDCSHAPPNSEPVSPSTDYLARYFKNGIQVHYFGEEMEILYGGYGEHGEVDSNALETFFRDRKRSRENDQWPTIRALACERFGHATFNVDTLRCVEDWVKTHCTDPKKYDGLTLDDIAKMLRDAAAGKPRNGMGKPPTPATSEQGEGGTPPPDPFANLRQFARDELKGQERAVIEALCDAGGKLPIVDLAVKHGVGWNNEFEGFKNARKRLKPKLKRVHFILERRDNAAILKRIRG